jgi:ribonucleoside-diphosphate reductase alpha chain
MEAVRDDAEFHLRSPKDGEVRGTVDARALWQKLVETRLATGEPYLVFSDTVNNAMPRITAIWASRFDLEPVLGNHPADRPRPSGQRPHRRLLPVVAQPREIGTSGTSDRMFIEDVMRFLDNVLQDFIDRAPDEMARAKYSPCASARSASA